MLIKMTALAFLGSVFPVILFNIDRKKIFWAGLGGALAYLAYSIALDSSGSQVLSSFWGAFTVNIYSELMARIKKTPAAMFYVPGIFPLVPGVTAYSTISLIVNGSYSEAMSMGMLTLALGGAIAFGIMLSSTLIKIGFNIIRVIK